MYRQGRCNLVGAVRLTHASNTDHGDKKSRDGKDAAAKKNKRITVDTKGEHTADADQLGERTLSCGFP
jgi:hypothetical protein